MSSRLTCLVLEASPNYSLLVRLDRFAHLYQHVETYFKATKLLDDYLDERAFRNLVSELPINTARQLAVACRSAGLFGYFSELFKERAELGSSFLLSASSTIPRQKVIVLNAAPVSSSSGTFDSSSATDTTTSMNA